MWRTRAFPLLGCLVILTIAAWNMHLGRRMPYTGDDMMNIYRAWTMPLPQLLSANLIGYPPGYRPFCQTIYRIMFSLTGFHSQPLHWVVWSAMILSLGLAGRLFHILSGSGAVAFLSTLFLASHTTLTQLSFNASTLYDTFCFTFYVSALILYLNARQRGFPRWGTLIAFLALFICSLNSKEMAVTLPVILLLWELLFHPPPTWSPVVFFKWLLLHGRVAVIAGGITAIFIALTLTIPGPETGLESYMPVITWSRWIANSKLYLGQAIHLDRPLGGLQSILLSSVLVLGAFTSRLRLFSLLWFFITLLPVSFITARLPYVLYLPLAGLALLFGTALNGLIDFSLKALKQRQPALWPKALGLFVATIGCIAWAKSDRTEPPRVEQSAVEQAARQFSALFPVMEGRITFLFLRDPFAPDNYDLLTTLRLFYRNQFIDVDRLGSYDQHPPLDRLPQYDHIFTFYRGRYLELDHKNTARTVLVPLLPGQSLQDSLTLSDEYLDPYLLHDVVDDKGSWRWTGAEPEFRFHLTAIERRFLFARFVISEETIQQNGPKAIRFLVNGQEIARREFPAGGTQEVLLPVPSSTLGGEEFTLVLMRVENPYTAAADQVVLGVLLNEIGFR